ncbi:molybdate ABC transporter substrate-binding protein [Erwinia sp. DT-104]|jgi:molybdate transport system substrate-binding protein|uniref:Molybdate ABC transporter substrate-binding protein n=1 Tax=Erwinia plantamica TaxID=3237104 RepID=A0ABW7CHV9_9GAMM|nr:substrate-binding domain-containing protein [Erwinia sp. PsM31]MDN4625899.1 substrate-binding domain-containing protein [Erwinia sp. PsM31]
MSNGTLRLFSVLAIRAPFAAVEQAWLRSHGDPLTIDWKPTSVIEKNIADGATADAVIVTKEAMDRLIDQGVVAADSRVELVDSPLGLAMLPDAVAPDISSVASFTRALLAAKSVAYSLGGASGIYFQALLKQLGIEEAINARATTIAEGFTAAQLLEGTADIAVQQISELLMVKGIKVIGPLPPGAQKVLSFSGGVFNRAARPEAAAALLNFLREKEAMQAFADYGLTARN